MTDYEKFLYLTSELKAILDNRIEKQKTTKCTYEPIPRQLCKARIKRLRLELFDCIRAIEQKCKYFFTQDSKEEWYK